MHSVTRELRFAFRQLWKGPGVSLTVVLILALGIGATTAMFSLVDGILLRPLPFSDPDRLVLVGDHVGTSDNVPVTAREIATYARSASAFSSLGAYIGSSYELSGGASPEEVDGARFTAGVFKTLGVSPILGRVFTQQEDDEHAAVALISYSLWRRRYQSDPRVLGRSILLDRKAYTIIGVMPRSFEFPLADGLLDQTQLWVPMSLTSGELADDHAGYWGYQIVTRLKGGVTLAQGAQDAARVARQVMREFPARLAAVPIKGDVKPLREYAVGEVRPLLRTLFLAVSIVLLIACVNVAGLLLVRALRRRREYAVRLALGARSGVIIRESVFEGLLLSTAGGLLGLGFAAIAIRTTLNLLPESMPRVDSISMDGTVAMFAVLLAVVTGAVCSLMPASAALRTNLTENLKEGEGSGTASASHGWLRSALVVSEIAIALVLLTVAGAFLRSFQKMRAVDPGFRPDHVLVANYQLPLTHYSTERLVEAFQREVIERLSSKPGIVAVGMTDILPASGFNGGTSYTVEGVRAEDWKLQFAMLSATNGDYFPAMGIPLIGGRYFTTDDRENAPLVVIVNQSMAQHCWPGQQALGKRIHVGNPGRKEWPWATVAGVVANTKLGARDEPDTDQWYAPAQQPAIVGESETETLASAASGYITLRSALPAGEMTQTLRATVGEIDPLLALQQVQPMDEVLASIEGPRRFNTDLISAFAAGALLLAVTGIYAVVAFSVSLRRQEIAVRMALGAQRAGIARLVVISSVKLALLGCGIGLAGSYAASRLVSSFLFEVSATDPIIYGVGVLIMMGMAVVASAIPARRAANADPMDALRSA